MNVADLVAKWGATYIDQGQTQKDITAALFTKRKTDSMFSPVIETNDVYRHVYSERDSVLQAFTPYFHSKGGTTLSAHEQKLGVFKINKGLKPDAVRNSFVSFWAELEKANRKDWNLIRYEIQQNYIPQSHDEYERDVAYRGWQVTGYDAVPTVNGATLVREFASADAELPGNASMDGIWIQIVRGVAAGKVNVVNTGALAAAAEDFVTQVEDFMMGIPEEARGEIDYLVMSEANYNKYLDGMDIKYNMNYRQIEDKRSIKKTMAKVEWIRGMDNSDKMWCTRPKNRVKPTHIENTGKFAVEVKDIYTIQVATDWKKVITFKAPELVFTNDLENTITAGNITTYYS